MLFTDTITLYNHYTDDAGHDAWKRTVLKGVQVSPTNDKVIDANGILQRVHAVSVTIPYRAGYRDPKVFSGIGFTLGLGNLDIVTLGVCNETQNITKLRKTRPDTWIIKSVNDNTNRDCLKHWRVICE